MKKEFSFEQKILNVLIMKSFYCKNIGLLTGKMGYAICFMHYYKYTLNNLYKEIANDLIDLFWKDIFREASIGFSSGLSGIGWGVDYLIHNNFVEGDSNEICYELDERIMEIDIYRLKDISLQTGIEGLLHYILARMVNYDKTNFDIYYLNNFYRKLIELNNDIISNDLKNLSSIFLNFFENGTNTYNISLIPFITDYEISENKLFDSPLSISNGLAGVLLRNIL